MSRTTDLIHSGDRVPGRPVPLTTPIFETTTYLFDNAAEVIAFNQGRSDKYLYSRYGNPTVVAVEQALAGLDGAEAALLCSSGMAATATTLIGHLKAGDEVLCAAAIYGGTLHLLHDLLSRFGITTRFVSAAELAALDSVFGERTRVVWFESPTNPTLRCVDVRAVAAACRARGVLSVLDNTFASPLNQQPLAHGVDLAMQSATKYLNGHSDVTAGVVCGSRALLAPIESLLVAERWPLGFRGYGLFNAPGRSLEVKLDVDVPAMAVVADRFVVTPLVGALADAGSFYLLAI